MNTSTLVKSVSITNMANQRAAVLERLRQALDLMAEAESLARAAHVGFPRFVIDNHYSLRGRMTTVSGDYSSSRPDVERDILQTVDGPAWQYLLSESGLRTFMDSQAREKWDTQIREGEVPPLTLDNIEATFGVLYGSRGEMFERGVIECFRALSWSYKTNTPHMFGKRIIMSYFSSYGHPASRAADRLDDLLRVFHVLDGKPEADHRQGVYYMASEAQRQGNSFAENGYLAMKWYKKGSAHITFKRLDLVEQLNRILAKHYPNALPPARA